MVDFCTINVDINASDEFRRRLKDTIDAFVSVANDYWTNILMDFIKVGTFREVEHYYAESMSGTFYSTMEIALNHVLGNVIDNVCTLAHELVHFTQYVHSARYLMNADNVHSTEVEAHSAQLMFYREFIKDKFESPLIKRKEWIMRSNGMTLSDFVLHYHGIKDWHKPVITPETYAWAQFIEN